MTAEELLLEYASAMERLRRHKRTIFQNRKCGVPDDQPCWVVYLEGGYLMEEMCPACVKRTVAYQFRKLALKDVGRLRRAITQWAKKQGA